MKRSVIILVLALIVLAGCATQQAVPEQRCRLGLIEDGDGCCRDTNRNSICDTKENALLEPEYMPVDDMTDPTYEKPSYEEPTEEMTEDLEVPEPTDTKIIEVKKTYVAPKPVQEPESPPELDWEASNDKMSIEITRMIIEVQDINQKKLNLPDKKAILKEVHMKIKDKGYNYMNFELLFRVQDDSDPLRIKKILKCSTDDDYRLEGCRQGIREGDVLDIVMHVDEEIDRVDIPKTFRFVLDNVRDNEFHSEIEISKTVNVLEIEGAEYI